MLCCIILHVIFMIQWSESQDIYDQEELVHMLVDRERLGYIKSHRVRDVMLATDRKHYVDKYPYDDVPVSVGYGATFATASVDAMVLQTLIVNLKKGATVLDVGSGTGYMSVLLAMLVGETGRVVAIDHIPELVNKSIQNVMKDKPYLLKSGRLKFIVGDGRQGTPNHGPYDVIHVGALILEEEPIPPALLKLLKKGGLLVIPVYRALDEDDFNELMVVERDEQNRIIKSFNGLYYESLLELLNIGGLMAVPVNRVLNYDDYNELLIVERDEQNLIQKSYKGLKYESVCEYLTDKHKQLEENLRPETL